MAAEALVHAGLKLAGATIAGDGSVIFPSHFMVKQLDSHFGVLAVKPDSLTYYLKSLHDVEEAHKTDSDSFAVDVRCALDLVRKGVSIAIIACGVVDGNAFTRLYVYPRTP